MHGQQASSSRGDSQAFFLVHAAHACGIWAAEHGAVLQPAVVLDARDDALTFEAFLAAVWVVQVVVRVAKKAFFVAVGPLNQRAFLLVGHGNRVQDNPRCDHQGHNAADDGDRWVVAA